MTDWFAEDERKIWTLADIYNDLGTRTDVSRILNVTPWRVHKWLERRERTKCPAPVRRLGHIDVYSMEEWKGWFARWQARFNPDTKWSGKARMHGQGQNFFTYEQDRR